MWRVDLQPFLVGRIRLSLVQENARGEDRQVRVDRALIL